MAYFPMFIELTGSPCLVVGGGPVAWHKVCVLRDFGAEVTVVAREVCAPIRELPDVRWDEKEYEEADLQGMRLVVAAADDATLNHRICVDCRTRGIPLNIVDQPADCDFIFPSYIRQREVVAAFSSGGQSPLLTQYLKRESESFMTPFIGELGAWLGGLRPEVKKRIRRTDKRRTVYAELMACAFEKNRLPTPEEKEKILQKMEREKE